MHLESPRASVFVDVWDRGRPELTVEVHGSRHDDGAVVELPVVPADLVSHGCDHLLVPLTAVRGSSDCSVELPLARSAVLMRGGFVGLRRTAEVGQDDIRRSLWALGSGVHNTWLRWAGMVGQSGLVRALIDEAPRNEL